MTRRWVLVLDPPTGDPTRKVGGLPLALRLALDAQNAGAAAVVVKDEPTRSVLGDSRLRIPVQDTVPTDHDEIRIGASMLTPRQLFQKLPAGSRDLSRQPLAIDVPYGFEAVDVVDRATARRAERALFRSLRKPQDGWTSRWLNRYISLSISRWLVKLPLRPNQVSIAILAIGLFGAWLALHGTYWSLVAGAALFQAQSVLDGCDGEMSRVTHRGSLLGEWLDTVGDDLTNYGFFAATGWGLYSATGHGIYLVAGAVTVLCGLIASGIEYRYLWRIGSGDLLKYPLSAGGEADDGGLFAAIRPLFKRDTFVFLTFLAALANLLGPMLLIFSAGGVGILASVIGAELRMARERRS
ncbi:MAG: CDP-alcohol phosphatidyltransferase family protein [Myxococcales bacterium]|nr:CDP-alcohol phosphatidyltransferase family protein [Myxococcales bacterium]MCB9576187.1 CDP-alcohol phosphatidyltransferase family protein [Polyangiaceae bacterium]